MLLVPTSPMQTQIFITQYDMDTMSTSYVMAGLREADAQPTIAASPAVAQVLVQLATMTTTANIVRENATFAALSQRVIACSDSTSHGANLARLLAAQRGGDGGGSEGVTAAVVRSWPGDGRHSNDLADFRMIQLVPTAGEVVKGMRAPFLPRSDGSDKWLAAEVRFNWAAGAAAAI
jgi:hypothetical protein